MLGFWKVRQQIAMLNYQAWTPVIKVLDLLGSYIREARGRNPRYNTAKPKPENPSTPTTPKPKSRPKPVQPKPGRFGELGDLPAPIKKKLIIPTAPPKPARTFIPGKPKDMAAIEEAIDILDSWAESINEKIAKQSVSAVEKLNLGRAAAAIKQLRVLL